MSKTKIMMTRHSFGGDGSLLEAGKTYSLEPAEARALVSGKKAVLADDDAKAAKSGRGSKKGKTPEGGDGGAGSGDGAADDDGKASDGGDGKGGEGGLL